MSDTHVLFAVLCLLYLSDCFFWVHRHSVAFLTVTGTRWRLAFPSGMLGNSQGGLLLANPLPPLGPLYFSHLLPVSFSPIGVTSYISQTLGAAGRPPQGHRFFLYKDIQSVDVSGKQVRINGEPFVRARASQQASLVADLLRKLLPLSGARREAEVKKVLRAAFDAEGAREKISECEKKARALHMLCNGSFSLLFVMAPALVWRHGITWSLLPIAAAVWLVAAVIVALFWRIHVSLYPTEREDRVSAAVKMLLCPPIAVRANDGLTCQLLGAYHPLAVAHLLCRPEGFQRFAKQVLLDLRHPVAAENLDDRERTAEQWYRETLEKIVEGFLKDCGVSPPELLKAPMRQDASSGSYCPRCEAEYAAAEGECADCAGVRLVAF